MENIVDILFEFKNIIKIISLLFFGLGAIFIGYSVMTAENEKMKAAVLLIIIGTIGLFFSVYSNLIVNKRGKVSLFEIQNKFVGKKVNVSGNTKKIKWIQYNEANKIEVQYTDGTKSETFKYEITDVFIILLIFVTIAGILSAVANTLAYSSRHY